ncbi:MAG: hypothetical protein KDB39_00920 [Austwickia sp.]|nr:hypothetical protein [Austwickia sp.]
MSAFRIVRRTGLDVEEAWAALTDFEAHGDVVPLTRLELDPGPPRLGWGLHAGTGVGPIRLWDHMIVTIWSPPPRIDATPAEFRVVKIGRWLRGWAHVVIEPDGSGSCVQWTEEVLPRFDPVPRLSAPLSRRAGERIFSRTVEGLLIRAEAADTLR